MPGDLRQRAPRQLWPGFLAYLRKQPCCLCGTRQNVEAAHIRMGSVTRGKEPTGMQEKPDDKYAVPLCAREHREAPDSQHGMGDEEKFWAIHEMNPFVIAAYYMGRYVTENPKAPPPYVRKQRPVKKRKPREQRMKIRSRNTLRRRP